MASFTINGASLTQKWSYVADPDAWWCYATMPTGTPADPSGDRRQLITSVAVAIAGQNATKTYSVFVADSGGGDRKTSSNYTVGYATAASLQPARALSSTKKVTAGGTIRVGFNQVTSPILVGRGEKAGINIVSEGPTGYGWSGYSLYGTIYYATLPNAPGSLSLSSTQDNPGQVTASWAVPSNNGGSSITGYSLQYSKASNFSTSTTVSVAGTSKTITGLDQGVLYYFRVAAINGVATAWSTTSAYSSTKSVTVATNPVKVAQPVCSPATGSYAGSVSVALSTSTPGATIYYTTNGTTPTTGSTVYSAPIALTTTTTIKVLATAGGFTNSDITTDVFTIVVVKASNGTTWANVVSIRRSNGTSWEDVPIQVSNGTTWINPV